VRPGCKLLRKQRSAVPVDHSRRGRTTAWRNHSRLRREGSARELVGDEGDHLPEEIGVQVGALLQMLGPGHHPPGSSRPSSLELNAVERVCLYLKERLLSHRLLDHYKAVRDAACAAWQRLVSKVGRITSLCSYPWIAEENPQALSYYSGY
jgi:hypothetical protein